MVILRLYITIDGRKKEVLHIERNENGKTEQETKQEKTNDSLDNTTLLNVKLHGTGRVSRKNKEEKTKYSKKRNNCELSNFIIIILKMKATNIIRNCYEYYHNNNWLSINHCSSSRTMWPTVDRQSAP